MTESGPSVCQPTQPMATRPFGLVGAPFGNDPDAACFFPAEQHLRALDFLGGMLWTRSRIGVVIADHGCGKSVLITRLLCDIDDRIIAASVSGVALTAREFLLEVLQQYGFALNPEDKTDRRRMLERFLAHQGALGRVCLLVVENAQQMHPTVLEELRFMASLEVEGVRVLKLLLLGPPSLNRVLDSPRMTDLVSAGVMRFSLNGFSEDQTAAYIAHHLRAAGAENPDELIPPTLVPAVQASTAGVPRRINQLCERALACAAAEAVASITPELLERARMELGWPAMPPSISSAIAALSADSSPPARLVVDIQGLPSRETILGHDRVLIGRGDEADVRIDSVFVSRYHALIVRHEGQHLLLDLGSTNGLLLNSQRIERRVLRDQDVVQIGTSRMTYLNPLAVAPMHPDPGETIRFARPGAALAAGEEDGSSGTIIAFGRLDPTRA